MRLRGSGLVLILTILIGMPACERRPIRTPERSEGTDAARVGSPLLAAAMQTLSDGVSRADFRNGIDQLNEYLEARSGTLPAFDPEVGQSAVRFIPSTAVVDAREPKFLLIDGEFLRNTAYLNRAARGRPAAGRSALDRIGDLFDWTCLNIQLMGPGQLPSGPPADVLLRGAGSAEERLWVFLGLVHQTGHEAFVIELRPDPNAGDAGDDPAGQGKQVGRVGWLAGALVEDAIHLFDPHLGLHVPSPTDPLRPATLEELLAHPETLLDLVSEPVAYPAGKTPATIGLALYVEGPMLAPKMEWIESQRAGEERIALTIPWERTLADARRLAERAAGANPTSIHFDPTITAWTFPFDTFDHLRARRDANTVLALSINPFWQRPRSPRLMQIFGQSSRAVERFVELDLNWNDELLSLESQIRARPDLAPAFERALRVTRQEIVYFTATTKLAQQPAEPTIARDWLTQYFEQFGSPALSPESILSWDNLFAELVAAADRPQTPAGHIWSRMDEPTRALVRQSAEDNKPQPTSPGGPVLTPREQLEQLLAAAESAMREHLLLEAQTGVNEQSVARRNEFQATRDEIRAQLQALKDQRSKAEAQLLQSLNALLMREDFVDNAVAFAEWAGSPAQVAWEASLASGEAIPPETRQLYHRALFELAFPSALMKNQQGWLAGATRSWAVSLRLEGHPAEAARYLRETTLPVDPTQREELLAFGRWLDLLSPPLSSP